MIGILEGESRENRVGIIFKVIMVGEFFRINECFRKLLRVLSGINISKFLFG